MSFTKITNTQLNSRGATTLPNQPTISATALKEEFDAPAKNIVAPAVNNLIDELQAVTSAANLGAVAPTGRTGATVQALLTDISDDLATVETNSHTHTNKTYIDKISEDGSGNPLYDGNPIGAGAAWGDITGTLSNQTDLQTALNGKANSSHTHTKSQITDFPSLATVATSGSYNDLSNKPTIPDELADLTDDSTHRTVTDTEKSTWNGKSTVAWNQITGATGNTKIATISINGTPTDVYAPSSGGGGGGSTTFAGLDDVSLNGSPSAGQIVQYTQVGADMKLQNVAMPSIPTVTDTYDGTSSNGMSGKAVKSAIDALDVSDSAVAGQYVSAVSETDGKISVTRSNLPTVPDELKDLTGDVSITTPSNGDVLTYDTSSSKWTAQAPASGGHTMIPVSGDMAAIAALNNGSNNYVINAYSAKRWSNCEAKEVLTTASQNADGVGTWEDDATWETSGVRTGWLWSSELYQVLEDGNGNTVLDIDISPVFDIGKSETVGLLSYRIDDDYPHNGTPGGCVAFKFTGAIKNANGVKVGLKLVHQRTEVNDGTILT